MTTPGANCTVKLPKEKLSENPLLAEEDSTNESTYLLDLLGGEIEMIGGMAMTKGRAAVLSTPPMAVYEVAMGPLGTYAPGLEPSDVDFYPVPKLSAAKWTMTVGPPDRTNITDDEDYVAWRNSATAVVNIMSELEDHVIVPAANSLGGDAKPWYQTVEDRSSKNRVLRFAGKIFSEVSKKSGKKRKRGDADSEKAVVTDANLDMYLARLAQVKKLPDAWKPDADDRESIVRELQTSRSRMRPFVHDQNSNIVTDLERGDLVQVTYTVKLYTSSKGIKGAKLMLDPLGITRIRKGVHNPKAAAPKLTKFRVASSRPLADLSDVPAAQPFPGDDE